MNSRTSVDLRGLWVPIVTPFDEHDRVDTTSLAALARRLLEDGARGLVALGTTGEPAVLSDEEQRSVIEVCDEVCLSMGRPLIVGAGTNSTRTTIEGVQQLAKYRSVVAALIVVPYYTRPSLPAIVEHFRIVAAASPVPIVVYNVPYRTGRGLGAHEILEIAAFENVIGIKQAVGGIDTDTLEVLRSAPSSFQVLAGDDAFIAQTVLMGGVGAIAAAAHVCTPLFGELIRAALAQDTQRTRALAERLLPIVQTGFAEPNPALWKAALHVAGELTTPNLRAPMTGATDGATQDLVNTITAATA